ncbi:hypothetical protein SETIT_9G376400v2 [Setaria italica]|uniref:Uncharacterized protein n=2 Tax=Setaria italica TaxID=4555 RepID=A0A368SQ38_SETIT|nr:hypothetical protein SETIT_9G376400v2 [Setaria italica]
MFFSKLGKVALLLVLMILLSSNHIMYSQGKPFTIVHRKFNLLSHSADEDTRETMTQGTISPDGTGNGGAGGGVLGEDTRATDPGHSPGAGHAATNNGVGRRLLTVN